MPGYDPSGSKDSTGGHSLANKNATAQNRNNNRLNPGAAGATSAGGGAKETFTTIRLSNNHGSIAFGQISKMGDVTGDVLIQASVGDHQISLDKDGPRKGFTSVTTPSNFQVHCGKDNKKAQTTLMMHAENGNIILNASNGKIILNANDIEFNVKGKDGKEGNFVVDATENITLKGCKKFQADAKDLYKIATPGIGELVSNAQLKISSGVCRSITAGVTTKDSKCGGKSYKEKQNKI
jgi:hypothetical protein